MAVRKVRTCERLVSRREEEGEKAKEEMGDKDEDRLRKDARGE